MGGNRTELGRQHGDSVKHVLLWAYSCIPHTGNSHILLESLVLLGLGTGLELRKGLVGLFLKIHLGEDLLHITGIAQAFLGTFSSDYLLELRI